MDTMNLLDSRFVLGAYWGPRREPVEDCARRLADCLHDLSKISSTFSGWRQKGASKAVASSVPLELGIERLTALMLEGRQYTDVGHELLEDLGFFVDLWNGQPSGSTASMSLNCGAFPEPDTGLMNSFILRWPEPREAVDIQEEVAMARSAISSVAEAWDPDWATWITRAMLDLHDDAPPRPALGLLTWFGPTRPLPPLDFPAKIEAVAGGQLLVLDPLMMDLPERLLQLRELLSKTEALRDPFSTKGSLGEASVSWFARRRRG